MIIATIHVPAIGSNSGWIRTAKTIHVTQHTPSWVVDIITDWSKASGNHTTHR